MEVSEEVLYAETIKKETIDGVKRFFAPSPKVLLT